MIKIEKNISHEIPADRIKWTNVLKKMEVGDSFECEQRFQNKFCMLARQSCIKIMTRTVKPKIIRVWRIE